MADISPEPRAHIVSTRVYELHDAYVYTIHIYRRHAPLLLLS